MLDSVTARSSGRDEISTLMVHGELALRASLPGHFSFRISWYQGIEGFTGWHSGASEVLSSSLLALFLRPDIVCLGVCDFAIQDIANPYNR